MTELNKENICIGEKSIPIFSQTFCESDVIVPDVYPDIEKIIQVSATAGITDKKTSKDRLTVEGKVEIVILYLGDDNCVYSISVTQPFNHTMEAKEVTDGVYTEAEINVDNIDYTILNSRKLNAKILMSIDANATEDVYTTLCTSVITDEPYEILNRTISPYKTVCRTTEQLCIRERLEIPNGKPSAEKILRVDSNIKNSEYSLSTDKMIVKGILVVTSIYTGDTDGKIHCTEHEIPFAEMVAMPDVTDDMKATLKLNVSRVFYKPEADADGDVRGISVECIITANAKAGYQFDVNTVKDAYCTKYPLELTKKIATVTHLIAENTEQISVKASAVLSENMPEINRVFNINPKVYLGAATANNGKVSIEGVIEADIIYISDEIQTPITTYKHSQPFSHTFEITDTHDDMICDVQLDIIHSSYTLALGRELDLRFVLNTKTNVLSNEKIEYISEISGNEALCYDSCKSYCIKIYFAKPSDDLWTIAKKHRITKDSLMEINNISSDSEIFDGKQLMIPIK